MTEQASKYNASSNSLAKLTKEELIKLIGAKDQELDKLRGVTLLSTDPDIVAIRTTITTLARKKKVKSYEVLSVVAKALKVKADIQPPQRSPAKYADPTNPRKTWSGKGAKPTWLKDILGKGKKLDELAI